MTPPVTAARQGLVSCHCCALVSRNPGGKGHPPTACPRCGATLHTRKTNSLKAAFFVPSAALVRYGEPIVLDELGEDPSREQLQESAERIMASVRALAEANGEGIMKSEK